MCRNELRISIAAANHLEGFRDNTRNEGEMTLVESFHCFDALSVDNWWMEIDTLTDAAHFPSTDFSYQIPYLVISKIQHFRFDLIFFNEFFQLIFVMNVQAHCIDWLILFNRRLKLNAQNFITITITESDLTVIRRISKLRTKKKKNRYS